MLSVTPDDPLARQAFLLSLLQRGGLSQVQAAKMLHVDERTFRRWCSPFGSGDYRDPPWAAVELLRRLLEPQAKGDS